MFVGSNASKSDGAVFNLSDFFDGGAGAVGSSSGSGVAALCTTAGVFSLFSAGSAGSLVFIPALQNIKRLFSLNSCDKIML